MTPTHFSLKSALGPLFDKAVEPAAAPAPPAGHDMDVPVVSLDLETTGTNIGTDKIVQLSLIRSTADGAMPSFTTYVNPGTPIPTASTAVHHITDQMVATAPSFKEIAQKVVDFIGDAILVGYGLQQFDIPVLEREFEDAGIELDLSSHPVVDVKILYHRLRPRRLVDAYRDYCGNDLQDAHDASQDARACLDVLRAMRAAHQDLPKGLAELAESLRDSVRVEPNGKFIWTDGHATFAFGKYQGQTLEWVAQNVPDYLRWIAGGDFPPAVRRIVRRALEGQFPSPPA